MEVVKKHVFSTVLNKSSKTKCKPRVEVSHKIRNTFTVVVRTLSSFCF